MFGVEEKHYGKLLKELVEAIGGETEDGIYIEDTWDEILEKARQLRIDRSKKIQLQSLITNELVGYECALIREYGYTKPNNALFARYDTLVTLNQKKNKIVDKEWNK